MLALRALTGMAAVLMQRFTAAGSLEADLAALEAGALPPDQRAATMLVANKKRVLGAAAQALAAALKVCFLLDAHISRGSRATTLVATKKHMLMAQALAAALKVRLLLDKHTYRKSQATTLVAARSTCSRRMRSGCSVRYAYLLGSTVNTEAG